MKDKIIFFFYILCLIFLINLHEKDFLFFLAVCFVIISYKTAIRAFFAIIFFNLAVTLGYLLESFFIKERSFDFLIVFNLRVFDITFLTLFIFSKIDILGVVSFSKTLRFLFAATLSQINVFLKTYEDFKYALKSRVVKKLNRKNKKEFIGRMFFYFFKKSLHNSKERTLALKARGFFD